MAPCYVVRASVSRGQDAENRVFPALLIRRSRVRISQFPPPNSEGNKLSLFVSLFQFRDIGLQPPHRAAAASDTRCNASAKPCAVIRSAAAEPCHLTRGGCAELLGSPGALALGADGLAPWIHLLEGYKHV